MLPAIERRRFSKKKIRRADLSLKLSPSDEDTSDEELNKHQTATKRVEKKNRKQSDFDSWDLAFRSEDESGEFCIIFLFLNYKIFSSFSTFSSVHALA